MIISMLERGCRVGFFGLGKSSTALLSHLPLKKCKITLRSDSQIRISDIPEGLTIDKVLCGERAAGEIDEDIIFFSPSVRRDRPELLAAREGGVIFSSDAELFFERNRTPVLAVTGSDGKSTTSTLIHLLLTAGGHRSRLIGNIGEPMIKSLDTQSDYFVCELSSFMLSYLTPQVEAACITNITPNHLDWHNSFEEYKSTKLSLLKGAHRTVLSDEFTTGFGIISDRLSFDELIKGRAAEVFVTLEDGYICKNKERLIRLADIRKKEGHNVKNLMMAIAMTEGMVGVEEIGEVAQSFAGLPHRCEIIFSEGGIDFIDSSIDSTPARTVQTLQSLDRPCVIILGGRGKGLDYGALVPTLKKYAEAVIITGDNADEIYNAIGGYVKAEVIEGFDEAVVYGKVLSKNAGTLLLSPASTSYDRFKNYAERGERFKEILLKNQLI